MIRPKSEKNWRRGPRRRGLQSNMQAIATKLQQWREGEEREREEMTGEWMDGRSYEIDNRQTDKQKCRWYTEIFSDGINRSGAQDNKVMKKPHCITSQLKKHWLIEFSSHQDVHIILTTVFIYKGFTLLRALGWAPHLLSLYGSSHQLLRAFSIIRKFQAPRREGRHLEAWADTPW